MRHGPRWLLYLGTAAVVLGVGRYHASFVGHYAYTGSSRFAWSLAYVALCCLAAYSLGLPELAGGGWAAMLPAFLASAAAATGISLAQLALGSQLLPRFVVASSVLVLTPTYTLCAFLAGDGRRHIQRTDRVLAVVEGEEAGALVAEVGSHPGRLERPVALAATMPVDQARPRRPGDQPLVDAAAASAATVVVLDRAAQADQGTVEQAGALHARGLRVRTLALFYEEWLGKLPVADLERSAVMFDIGELHRARYSRLKRLSDIAIGAVGLVPLVASSVLVLAADVAFARGPLFYSQARVGKGGREFRILKFRTMTPRLGAKGWAAEGDPRVTPVGRVLRRAHLDELPQVLNILRGDLSVVGPRPEQPQYVAELSRKLPFYELRHLVRPGLTGWAQVKYGYGASESDALEKLQYELYYLHHQSLGLDLRVMGRTVRAVVGGEGR